MNRMSHMKKRMRLVLTMHEHKKTKPYLQVTGTDEKIDYLKVNVCDKKGIRIANSLHGRFEISSCVIGILRIL